MLPEQKTVFISYRRNASKHFARIVFMELLAKGYDVFVDYDKIDSGTLEPIILSEIGARAHFILLISSATFAENQSDDWVLQEYQEALRLNRNIIPILDDDVDFELIKNQIPDEAESLSKFNFIRYASDYHEAFVEKLCDRFLKEPRFIEIEQSNENARVIVKKIKSDSIAVGVPTEEEKSFESWFNSGYENAELGRHEEAIEDYSRAIELNPIDADSHFNRGLSYEKFQQYEEAIKDYTMAIEIDPDFFEIYIPRGNSFAELGQYELAIEDYTRAIEHDPDNKMVAYFKRGSSYSKLGRYAQATVDITRANDELDRAKQSRDSK